VGDVIRALTAADRAAVCRILQACGAFTPEEVAVALELVDDAIVRGGEGDYRAFVADRVDEVRGYVCIGKTPMTATTWHLYWLCVDPEAWGRGVERALQAYVESFVRRSGGERLVLEASSQPGYRRARRFYEANGYRQVGCIPDFYKANDDCLVYCKALT